MRSERLEALKWKIKWRLDPLRKLLGGTDTQWGRVVMDRATAAFVRGLGPETRDALEISGDKWEKFGFASYRSVHFPEYDVCAGPLDATFDIIIAEQVLEHVLWPYRAVRNMHAMLRPGGVLVLTTPFLVMVHDIPVDCSRWTPLGLKYLLAEAGFGLEDITSQAWGNRACVVANFPRWPQCHRYIQWARWNRYFHSLRNEQEYPVHVWAFAIRK